jgi:hypothetical protein
METLPARQMRVFIFPADPRTWGRFEGRAPRTVMALVTSGGRFASPPLRPGSYCVVAIHGPAADTDWREAASLARMAEGATRVTLREGDLTDVVLTATPFLPSSPQ